MKINNIAHKVKLVQVYIPILIMPRQVPISTDLLFFSLVIVKCQGFIILGMYRLKRVQNILKNH